MSYDMMNSPSSVSPMRPDYDLPANAAVSYNYKSAYAFPGRGPHSSLTIAEQAELEYELRYRGNMIVDQQRKIQQLEEELRQARDQVEMMNTQLNNYEQDRAKEKKKPQSRYWTPEEHQRFLEALQKYGHKDVKSISMHVSTRNATQVRTHAQKYFLRLERERRKKDENSGHVDGYDSSGSLDDGSPSESQNDDMISSVPISSLTLPGSPAVNMIGEIGTPPGTPGDSTPGTPGTPSAPSSPIPRRRRATSFITVAQARLAAQHRDSVLVGLPPTWTIEDYEMFMKGLLTLADKQDDVSTLCRMIREQYLPHHTPDEVELCYRNVLKNIKQKPIVGSPKRRRTNSRPEPLTSPLGVSSSFAPSFPVPPVSTLSSSFPFRNSMNSPTSNNVVSSMPFGSSPPTNTSPLSHNQSANLSSMRNTPPFSDYGQLTTGLEFPMMSELNLNGVSPMSNANTNSPPNNSASSSPVTSSPQQQHHHQHQHQQHQQQQQQQPQQQQQNMHNGLPINQSSLSPHLNSNAPITPSSLWGSALPFSFDALMSGNVALPQAIPLVSHN